MNVREHVQRYLERGFYPMPMWGVDGAGRCLCGGKLPDGKECRPGKHAPELIEGLWKDRPRFSPVDFREEDNVALALGPWQRGEWLVCLDMDGPGDPSLLVGPLPPTLTQASPRGRHYFFTVRAFEALGNWSDAFLTKYSRGYALDIRYARGRINVAPSRTAFGTYRWENDLEPAPLPRSAINAIHNERRRRNLPVTASWDRGGKAP